MIDQLIAQSVFYEIALLLALAALIGAIGQALRQPLIVSFIAAGVLAGPSLLGIAQTNEYLDLLASLGIAVLLFLVGLKLDVKLIRNLGAVAVTTGLGQVGFTAGAGFLICLALGLDVVTSVYVAVALTFSSTIIIVKLLSDKREIDSLHGRIALGFLIVQDIVVVLAMVVLSAIGVGAAAEGGWGDILRVIASGLVMVGLVALFIKYGANRLVGSLAKSPELLVCFAIGWAALLAAVADYLGLSKEMGGLLAGVSLASTPFREALAARLSSLRDFLLLFFFIALGASLDVGILGQQLVPALILSVFVLVGNPLIVLLIMMAMGYRRRTGFLAGLTVAQISEFSLIFIAVGVSLGHLAPDAMGLVTLVGLITIALSTYMILYSHQLWQRMEPLIGRGDRGRAKAEQAPPEAPPGAEMIVFGLGRYGGTIARLLRDQGHRVLGIDFNPTAVERWRDEGLPVLYGDVTDAELIGHLPLDQARWVICAVPDHDIGITHSDPRRTLVDALKEAGYRGQVAIASQRDNGDDALASVGADLVLRPYRDAALYAVEVMTEAEPAVPRVAVIDPQNQRELAL